MASKYFKLTRMSILDDNLDISQEVLTKVRLVELIHQSIYPLALDVTVSNLHYAEPPKTIKHKERYSLAITYVSHYVGNGNYERMYHVKWVCRDDHSPYYRIVNKSTIDLDEFEKNKGYFCH